MVLHRLGTSARGYGHRHQQQRVEALRAFVDGTPCHHCGKPMHRSQKLDLDHVRPMAHGGSKDGPRRLSHASCNRAAGARIVNARRGAARSRVVKTSRAW